MRCVALTRDRARSLATRAGPRDARASAPARAEAAVADVGDRASRRHTGAVAVSAVRRHLDALGELPAGDARARARTRRRPQGNGDAADAAPRHPAGLRAPPRGDERDDLPWGG